MYKSHKKSEVYYAKYKKLRLCHNKWLIFDEK